MPAGSYPSRRWLPATQSVGVGGCALKGDDACLQRTSGGGAGRTVSRLDLRVESLGAESLVCMLSTCMLVRGMEEYVYTERCIWCM